MGVFYRQSPLIIGDADVADIGDPKVGLINGNSGGPGYHRYFDTKLNQWYYWNGSSWVPIGDGDVTVGSVDATSGYSAGGVAGADGEVEMVREGGGKVKLTISGGIITGIEDEA